MPDFTVRADHIDVEQIMQQIRTRIRDKRGVDYTEAEVRELASVKLDRFLDPRAVRSDLLAHFRRQHQPTPLLGNEEWPALYQFDAELAYGSSRGALGQVLRLIRRVLNPILKLFINPGPILHVLHLQGSINEKHRDALERVIRGRDELDALNFEMFNNLVVEATRLGIEVKNLRMQVESLSTRLDFDERRGRALEGVVQFRPGAPVAPPPPVDDPDEESGEPGSEGRTARRRRRRRGRRRGTGEAAAGSPDDRSSDQSPDKSGESSNGRADLGSDNDAGSGTPSAASSAASFHPSLETGPGDYAGASALVSPPDSTTGPPARPTPPAPSDGDHPRHGAEPSES